MFFLHDSDHDPRETATILKEKRTGREDTLNFEYSSKLQRHFSPLFAKRVLPKWKVKTARQLPCYVGPASVGHFKATVAENAADFCLEMYVRMGLMDGVRVERSGDPKFRRRAIAVDDYFVDVQHEGELVRARARDGKLSCTRAATVTSNFRRRNTTPARSARRAIRACVGCNR